MNLNFKFSEDIEEENRGFIVHRLSAMMDGRELGYIKVSYIPHSIYKTSYASALDYAVKHAGWYMPGFKVHHSSQQAVPNKKQLQSLLSHAHIDEIVTDENYASLLIRVVHVAECVRKSFARYGE